jgi:hypothetical protein
MPRLCWIALLAALAVPAAAHDADLHKLPLGDGKISQGPKAGWIWACHVDPNGGGAQRAGPWIDQQDRTFDLTAKTAVRGMVRWPHHFTVRRVGDKRVLTSNDFPDHPTGRFPIARDDPAYWYDRNPNRITPQSIHIELPANPKLAAQPRCAPAAVGVLLTGVALFNALDAPGRDALAHETQDRCQGHPQRGGVYHYHSLTSCLPDKPGPGGNSLLVGYAIDGFGIYGSYENGKRLTSADLDACHGRSSVIDWDGRKVKMYHYVATADFPYTVGCLRGGYDRALVRAIAGAPPGLGRFGGPGRPPPGMGPPFGRPPPR